MSWTLVGQIAVLGVLAVVLIAGLAACVIEYKKADKL